MPVASSKASAITCSKQEHAVRQSFARSLKSTKGFRALVPHYWNEFHRISLGEMHFLEEKVEWLVSGHMTNTSLIKDLEPGSVDS